MRNKEVTKKWKGKWKKKLVSAVLVAALVVQTGFSGDAVQVVNAETSGPTAEAATLITDYKPTIETVVDETSGFTHPGLGVTKELLDNVQTQVRAGQEPWASYFDAMLKSGNASRTFTSSNADANGNVSSDAFNSQGFNGRFKNDAIRAYTQAVLYYVTGDVTYRANAMKLIRVWEQMDPAKYEYFTDSHIHTGIPLNRICIAAEILRYSSYEANDTYTDTDLAWTEDDTKKFSENLLTPCIETFNSSPDRFMNQHTYTVIGAMSGYLFMDDKEGYEKMVEWITVNKDARDPAFTGSIKMMFREITREYSIGDNFYDENDGIALPEPVYQHVEMGRDQAHGGGDFTNAAIISRMMLSQGTKVDPEDGTASTEDDAVGIFEFLDDRILKTADYFWQYMLGYDTPWVKAPYSIDKETGIVRDTYNYLAPGYRGRFNTANFWDIYAYYKYVRQEDMAELAPYFHEAFEKKLPSNFYYGGSLNVNWDGGDGGGDFWLFLPAEAANDAEVWAAETQVDYLVEVEDRGTVVSNKEKVSVEEEYIRFAQSDDESKIAITTGSHGNKIAAFKVRTDGEARLDFNFGVFGTVMLPDTNGEWCYVTYTRTDAEYFEDLMYMIVSDMEGTYVDIDHIDIKVETKNDNRTINIVQFEAGSQEQKIATYVGAPLALSYAATANTDVVIEYSGSCMPNGATVDQNTGAFAWTPGEAGVYPFYISVTAGETVITKKVVVEVGADRQAAIDKAVEAYDEDAIYVEESEKNFMAVWEETLAAVDSASNEDFAVQLNKLCEAADALKLVSPLLANGSLDYREAVTSPSLTSALIGKLVDGDGGSHSGYGNAVNKTLTLDFGMDYKVSVDKFEVQSNIFADRLAGCYIYASNDGVNWTKITEETKFTQEVHEVKVLDEYKGEKYRYFMLKKEKEYPDILHDKVSNLLEISEWYFYGTRYEIGNKIESISMSSEQSSNDRIKMGDTVTLTVTTKEPIKELSAVIQGHEATVKNVNDTTWTASAVMESGTQSGNVVFTLDYVKADDTAGDTLYSTTDDTSLFLVNSDIFVDTGLLAAEITASVGSWDKKLTAEQCGKLLFDGDVKTFGDLLNTWGEYYSVDFGEGVAVALEEVMFIGRPESQAMANRMNGAIVSGSNDGETWTELTKPVSGAVVGQWTQLKGNDILDKGAYRYFRISGAEQGDIAEVEFYGSYQADPALIAGKITSLDDQQPSQTKMVFPSVPSGFKVTVKESSNEEVVALDGSINTPQDDTEVTLTLTVTHTESGQSADTIAMPVIIKGIGSLIKGVTIPERGAETLTLPTVPEGFVVTVKESSNPEVVATGNGAITTPDYSTLVDVTLELVRSADNATVVSGPYTILIYGENESQKVDVASLGSLMSTSPQWSNPAGTGLSAEEIVKLVFDGDTGTFGDLQDTNGYYTVTFDEEMPLVLDKVRFYPRSTAAEHATRVNNTYIEGSVDGTNWVQITNPVKDSVISQWYEITADEFMNHGAYTQFRVKGAKGGGIAEVEFYGIFDTTAEAVAASITDIPDVLATQNAIVVPVLPTGYTLEVATSSNLDVIAKDGTVNVPQNNTDVTLTFNVIGFGDTATTGEIVVNVQGMAGLVTALKMPAADATTLTLPEVPAGFALSIATSSDKEVIALDGTITTPAIDTLVDVALRITRTSDNAFVDLPVQTILVYGAEKNTKIAIKDFATVTVTSASVNVPIENMFDGDLDTFAEINKDAGFYTIDFGEGASVILDLVKLWPRNDANAKRMDGAQVYGSNDGRTWTPITEPVTGATAGQWKEFAAESFQNYGAYRYFKIAGMKLGQFGEIEFYGVCDISNETIINAAKKNINEALTDYVIAQADANTEAAVKEKVEAVIEALDLHGVTAEVVSSEGKYVEAVAGNATKPDGVNGSYSFVVNLTLGEETTVPMEELTVVIEATQAEGFTFLTAPTGLTWNGKHAGFTAVDPETDVYEYAITLYKDGTEVADSIHVIAATGESTYSYYFVDEMVEAGNYTFKVVAKSNPANENIIDSEAAESPVKAYVPADIAKGDLIASFDFDDLADGVTEITGSNAKATVEGSAVYADSFDGSKAAKISSAFWLNVTKADGTAVLAGLDEITISYDTKSESTGNGTGWAFYTAPNTDSPKWTSNIKRYYLGINDRTNEINVERFKDTKAETLKATGFTPGWRHIDVVVTLEDIKLYVDGELKGEKACDTSYQLSDILTETGGIFQIGKGNWNPEGEYYTGLIDNFEIYARGIESEDAIAVADAKAAVEAAITDIELAQADVADEAAAKAAVQAAVDAAIAEAGMEGVTAVVEGNGYIAPTAGTEDAEDGVDGAYTFIVTLTKGEESDVVAEKTVVITAKAYDAHQHTFSTEWTSDDTYHWHAATCEHTEETLDKAEHTSSDWIVDAAASTTAAGSRHKECTVCEKVLVTEEIPQLPGEVTGGITGTVKSFSSDSTVDNTTTIQLMDVSGNVIAQTTVAESEGSYTLTDVSAGDYTVQVSKEDHVTREYCVTVGNEMVTLNVEVWLLGDVNGDGDVNAKDKKLIFNHIEGNSLTEYAFAVGNVDGKGDIDAKDKKMVYNHIEGNSLLWN